MAANRGSTAELVLSSEERLTLDHLANRRESAQAMAMRARIVMAYATGDANRAVAEMLGVSDAIVGKWRRSFVEQRLGRLFDELRPGAQRSVTDDQVEEVIVKTWRTSRRTPRTSRRAAWPRRWASVRPQSGASGGLSAVSRTGPNPSSPPPIRSSSRRSAKWSASFSTARARRGGLCGGLLWWSVWWSVVVEKPQIQALKRFQPNPPMMPGTPERRSHDYVRTGATGSGRAARARRLRHPYDARDPALAGSRV
jgi:hypothetical protein